MYPEALTYLCCPPCPDTRLFLEPDVQNDKDGAILFGRLCCHACGRLYPIKHGIADMLGSSVFPDSPAQVANDLPVTAWAYERVWRGRALTLLAGEPFGYERELPLITALAAPDRGGLYIDVACSNGLYARALDHHIDHTQGHIVGIDHSLPMLRQGREFARKEQRRISFVRASAQALPFASGSATGVVMGGSLNEIGDLDTCLRAIQRVMASTGRCVLMHLAQAEHVPGQVVQSLLKLGGVDFLPLGDLNIRLQAHGLRLCAQWRYRVVVFSLLVAQ